MSGGVNSTTIRRDNTPDGANTVSAFIYAPGATGFRLQDLRIELPGAASGFASNAAGSQTTNYAVYLGSGCSSYNIVRCYIDAGAGGSGNPGGSGSAGGNGSNGAKSTDGFAVGLGGAGGNAGGNGGTGSNGSGNATNGAVGGGAAGGTAGPVNTGGDGAWGTNIPTAAASDGNAGGNGSTGATGTVGTAGIAGTYAGGYYVIGGNGGIGGTGVGGGGGGGGGGGAYNSSHSHYVGYPGDGGGGGGYGGTGGTGGTAGGGCFGVFSLNEGAGGAVTDCNIVVTGGPGGAGGTGGTGGAGGLGNTQVFTWQDGSGQGGAGGTGGNGGQGGTGGTGGAGGTGAASQVCNLVGTTLSSPGPGTFTALALAAQPIIIAGDVAHPNINCTNIAMDMTTAAGGPTWSGSAPLGGAGSPDAVTYTTLGRKTVIMTSGGANTYTDFNNMITSAPSAGSIVLSASPICPGVAAIFSSTLAGSPGFTYSWSFNPALPGGVTATPGTPTASSTSITFTNSNATAQVVTMQLIVTSQCCGALVALTKNITIEPDPAVPTAIAVASNICPGSSSTLSITSSTASLSFNWYTAAVGGVLLGSGTSLSVSPLVTTTYYVDATNANGCVSTSRASVTVTVTPTPAPTCPGISICGAQNATLAVSSPIAGATYNWDLSSGTCGAGALQSSPAPDYSQYVAATTTFFVSVIAPGCNISACTSVTITVNAAPTTMTWTGTGNNGAGSWFDPVNWGGCGIPSCGINAVIPVVGSGHYPNIGYDATFNPAENSAACNNITLNSGTTLTFSDIKSELDICGDFAHSGTVTMASQGKIVFQGTVAQHYTKSNTGAGDLFTVVLSNTAATPSLTIMDGVGGQDMNIAATNGTFTFVSGNVITQNTRTLCIKNTDTTCLSGYGINNYVIGNLRRYVSYASNVNWGFGQVGGYNFPVGNTTSYQLFYALFQTMNGLHYLTVSFDNPANANGTGLPLSSCDGLGNYTTLLNNGGPSVGTGAANAGVWTVFPDTYVATLYNVQLNGRNYSNAPGGGPTYVSHLKRNTFCPGIWTCDGGYDYSTIAGNVVQTSRDSHTGFSQFAIAISSTVLPIDLSIFEAACVNKNVQVSWTSASENNNAYYTIERSCEGASSFQAVGKVAGAGNSSTPLQYTFIDSTFPGNTCYYRLKQTDFNGTPHYLKTIAVSCKDQYQFDLVNVYPNPVVDELNVFFNADKVGPVQISITDLLGKVLISQSVPAAVGLNQTSLDMTSYSNSVYFIRLNNGERTIVRKVTKQH